MDVTERRRRITGDEGVREQDNGSPMAIPAILIFG